MKHNLVVLLLLLLGSCQYKKNALDQPKNHLDKKPIDLEYVKKRLCYQAVFDENDTIRCPDSIWVIQLKNPSLYLTQSYYGSGYGNGIWVNLIQLKQYSYTILDSLFWYNADDLFKPENIEYTDSLNWFYYIEEGGGTNHYSETKHIVRIEGNKFIELISIPQYVSDMDPEVTPMTYTSLKTTEIEVTKKRIVLKAIIESGIEKNGKTTPLKTKEDRVTFDYSNSLKKFSWKSSTNMEFNELWTEKKMYNAL